MIVKLILTVAKPVLMLTDKQCVQPSWPILPQNHEPFRGSLPVCHPISQPPQLNHNSFF